MVVVPVDVVVVVPDVAIFIADTAGTTADVVVVVVVANIIVIIIVVIVLPRLGFTCMLLISVLPENSHNLPNICNGDIKQNLSHFVSAFLFSCHLYGAGKSSPWKLGPR